METNIKFIIVLIGFLYQVVFSIEADAAVGDSAVNAAKVKLDCCD